jgi:transposase InsO family protein
VLSWRLSNTLTTDFCIEAVTEAIPRFGAPEIFNTDQGSQCTSLKFTQLLKDQSRKRLNSCAARISHQSGDRPRFAALHDMSLFTEPEGKFMLNPLI